MNRLLFLFALLLAISGSATLYIQARDAMRLAHVQLAAVCGGL